MGPAWVNYTCYYAVIGDDFDPVARMHYLLPPHIADTLTLTMDVDGDDAIAIEYYFLFIIYTFRSLEQFNKDV